MEKRAFGKTGMNVSVLGFGGAEIGFQQVDGSTVSKLLNSALDSGLNVIDTAECYVDSEEKIGAAVAGRRDDFYLFTKCGHKGSYDVDAWDKDSITASIEQSLKRLRTDRVDLVQLHSCSEEILRQGDVIEALQQAKQAGKTRFIGYSGDSAAAVYAINTGVFDSLQTSLNIADQEAVDLLLPLARAKQMGVIVKRPVANAAWKEKNYPDYFYIQTYWQRLQALKYEFIKGNLSTEVAHALRFTLMNDGVHTAIVGTTQPNRWQQNAQEVAKGPLSKAEYDSIRSRWQEVVAADWVGQN